MISLIIKIHDCKCMCSFCVLQIKTNENQCDCVKVFTIIDNVGFTIQKDSKLILQFFTSFYFKY